MLFRCVLWEVEEVYDIDWLLDVFLCFMINMMVKVIGLMGKGMFKGVDVMMSGEMLMYLLLEVVCFGY